MSTLAEAKKALQFNQEFVQLVQILKGIAASQFQALMRKRHQFEVFAKSFEGFFKLVDLARIDNPFVRSQSETTGVLMITSDEGFMGGLNAKVIQAALEEAGTGPKEMIVVGTRGADYLKDLGVACTPFPGVTYEKRYERAVELRDFIVRQVVKKKIGRLILAHPHCISLTVQKAVVIRLLPCVELFQKQGISPGDNNQAQSAVEGEAPRALPVEGATRAPMNESRVILESSPERIIEYLVGIWITDRLYDLFEDSKLAEVAARTIHLEQSFDRLTGQGKVLRYRYFRSRRELIDKGTRETFASILLRRGL